MNDPGLVELFVRPLNRLRIPYMVTGGVASIVYGDPRFTRDIDLVIDLESRDAARFAAAWSIDAFYVPPIDVIAEESSRSAFGHFNVIHHATTMRADVYLPGNDALNAWAIAHRVMRQLDDDEVWIAPIEAVILSKLRDYQVGQSDRHLRDIHHMLRVSGTLLDRAALEGWALRIGVEDEWRLAQQYRENA